MKTHAIAALLALVPAAAAVPSTEPARLSDREQEARELLERGEEKAEKGLYDRALDDYREVVEDYAGTEASRTAEKRILPNALLGWSDMERSGDSANRVDVVVMGDGYTLKHLKKSFHPRSEEVQEAFERDEVLAEYLPYFNFVRAAVVSAEDNVDGHGREYDTALDAYLTNTAGEAFAAVKPERVMHYLDQMPAHDGFAFAIVKTVTKGESRPGVATIGGAVRNFEQILHAFGHGFAGLGDEFTDTNQHQFPLGAHPNLSASEEEVPWQHMLEERVRGVGVYEGAAGRVSDLWRPVASNCVMNQAKQFCPVCREAVVLAIYHHVDGIDACTPDPHDRASAEELVPDLEPTADDRYQELQLEVVTMRPESHDLEVTWWVVPEHRAPQSAGRRLTHDERAKRGPLPEIELEPAHFQRTSKTGHYAFTVDPADLEPGRYRVICRAVDTTELRGERNPWVISDPAGLLESERAWWIRIPGP